jgi:hypothetical protein
MMLSVSHSIEHILLALYKKKKVGIRPLINRTPTMVSHAPLTQTRHQCKKKIPFLQGDDRLQKMERAMGLEPTTSSLGS